MVVQLLALATLSHFQPHKARAVTVLNTLAFTFTMIKYLVAIMFRLRPTGKEAEVFAMFMIGMDIFFVVSGGIAIIMSAVLIRSYIREAEKKSNEHKEEHDLRAINQWS